MSADNENDAYEALAGAAADALHKTVGYEDEPAALAVLDAVLPLLGTLTRPHRWDHKTSANRPPECTPGGPDSFYNGVLHIANWIDGLAAKAES